MTHEHYILLLQSHLLILCVQRLVLRVRNRVVRVAAVLRPLVENHRVLSVRLLLQQVLIGCIVNAIADEVVLVPLEFSMDELQEVLHFMPEDVLQGLINIVKHGNGDDDNDDVEPDNVEDADNAKPILPVICVSEQQQQGATPHFMKSVGQMQTEAWGIPFRLTLLPNVSCQCCI